MKGLWQMFSRFGRSTVRVAKMEHVFEPEDRKLSCLFRFDSESAIGAFRLHTDADMGGKSSARFYFDSEKKCAVLEGNLDLTTPPGICLCVLVCLLLCWFLFGFCWFLLVVFRVFVGFVFSLFVFLFLLREKQSRSSFLSSDIRCFEFWICCNCFSGRFYWSLAFGRL